MIAGLQYTHASGQYRRHARCRGDASRAAFHRGQTLLEGPNGWVGKPGLDVTRRIAGKAGSSFRGASKYKTRCRKYRFGMFALVGTVVPDP